MIPFSVISYHNKFLRQARDAYITGAFYPALTATCALGERILNRLVIRLRKHFAGKIEYKRVCDKNSFDNWGKAIGVLDAWGVFLPGVAKSFSALGKTRHGAIHFRPEVDEQGKDEELAREAIGQLSEIISKQFSFGDQPWFIPNTKGEFFIKNEYENSPFVLEFILPCCLRVGPFHWVDIVNGIWHVHDDYPYEDREISDGEFVGLLGDRENHPKPR
ncbi:hypothetical protein HQ520_00080 [bacterium]|nr:hypothetical protein [bacterium]